MPQPPQSVMLSFVSAQYGEPPSGSQSVSVPPSAVRHPFLQTPFSQT
jgi:hypothetical protein